MSSSVRKIAYCCLFIAVTATTTFGLDFYVAPNGSDDNPGTLAKPFATIARARDAVRPLTRTMENDITVWIRGGRYHLSQSIELDDRDGGAGKHNVIYKNYKDEKPVIIGGVPVTGWTPYKGGIMKADVGKDIEFWSLLVGDKLATMAGEKVWYDKPPKSVRNLQIYSQKVWMSEYLRVTSFDAASKKVTLEFDRSPWAGKGVYMRGSYTFINAPGQWAVDSDSGTLYYLPKSPAELKNIVRPTVKAVFQIRGRRDSQQVRNVVIEGLRLLLTDFNANMRCYAGRDRKTGIENHGGDYPSTIRTALVAIENANNIQVRYCDLGQAPINGISIYRHAAKNTVYGCRIDNIGYMGVCLIGPWVAQRAPNINNNNTVRNCLIRNLTKGVNHPAGVGIYQSGDNKIQNNMIHTSKRYAISTKGLPRGMETKVGLKKVPYEEWYTKVIHSNRNLISHNYLYDCVKDSSDAGPIELWGAGRDTDINNNIIFNAYNHGPKNGWRGRAIMFDNGMAYATVTNNIMWNTRTPAGNSGCVTKGVDMVVRNNVFDISFNSLGSMENQGQGNHDFSRNIAYADCSLKSHLDGAIGPEKDGTRRMFTLTKGLGTMGKMDNNVYYNAQGPLLFSIGAGKNKFKDMSFDQWRQTIKDKGDFDANSRIADPQFVDVSARDYRLRETSPALDLGISSIDTFSIGLLEDFPFALKNDPLRTVFLKANGKDVYLEAPKGGAIKLRVTARTKQWYVADLSKANIRYSVDDPKVATVSDQGEVTLKGNGRACITATVTQGGVTRSDDVVVYVAVARGAKP